MLTDFFPFVRAIDKTAIAGSTLWALALYLGFSPVGTWTTEQINRWLNFAERSLYTSAEAFEKERQTSENQNAFYASVLSIVPFLITGIACHYGLEWSLGRSWSISTGILAVVGCGIFELGRRNSTL